MAPTASFIAQSAGAMSLKASGATAASGAPTAALRVAPRANLRAAPHASPYSATFSSCASLSSSRSLLMSRPSTTTTTATIRPRATCRSALERVVAVHARQNAPGGLSGLRYSRAASSPTTNGPAARQLRSFTCASAASDPSESETADGKAAAAAGEETSAGAGAEESADSSSSLSFTLGDDDLEYAPLEGIRKLGVQLKMLVAWPWRRVKKNSVLYMRLGGNIPEMVGSSFSPSLSLPQICGNLRKAAVDPRVSALLLHVDPLQCGWGKLQEMARHVEHFKKSGKPTIAYLTVGGEQEFFLASACEEVYAPPGAYLALRGLAVQGQFLGGVLHKAGVTPQIERIGKFKSAGDQLARSDMADANREMLTAILEDFYRGWTTAVAGRRGLPVSSVESLLSDGVQRVEEMKERGFLTDVKYSIELESLLKERLSQKKDKPLQTIDAKRYSKVSLRTLGLEGRDRIAVLRAVGAISQGKDRGGMGGGVKSESIIQKIRMVKDNNQFKALILRVDSPGGDALASDLMWNEIRELAKVKPVVASMSDVAASGGYYMAMAAPTIVAEPLTLTGSIGVVTGKFSLADLYARIGFSKEIISRGRFAELNADQRTFTPDEGAYFAEGARIAYQRFRDKAALSRDMEPSAMEEVAQGRVWTGQAALRNKLVDRLGGIWTAVQLAKEKAGIDPSKRVRLVELSRSSPSITGLLFGGAQAAEMLLTLSGFFGLEARASALRSLAAEALLPPALRSIPGLESSLGFDGFGRGSIGDSSFGEGLGGVMVTGSNRVGASGLGVGMDGVQAVMSEGIQVRGSGSEVASAVYAGEASGDVSAAELALLLGNLGAWEASQE